MQIVGFEKVDIRDGRLIKSDPRVSLDFNAIAQGLFSRHYKPLF
jgi:thiamine biosynthesis lipoprotein ApbE